MKSVILAGGKGTRLAPYTTVLPKPLMPVGPMPILEIVLRQQYFFGFRDVTLACGYLSQLIEAYLLRHPLSKLMNIKYFVENRPLGTAGALRAIAGLDEPFLVMNGDILTAIDYGKLFRHHRESGAALTIAVTKKRIKVELGVLVIDGHSHVVGYDEKPVKEFPASTGIYIYDPRVLNYMVPEEHLDFPTLVLRLIKAGETVSAYSTDEFWLDIGNKDDFELAAEELRTGGPIFICGKRRDLQDAEWQRDRYMSSAAIPRVRVRSVQYDALPNSVDEHRIPHRAQFRRVDFVWSLNP